MLPALTGSEFQRVLDHAGSWKVFVAILGMDSRDLDTLRIRYPDVQLDKLGGMDHETLASELKRVGSTRIFCLAHCCRVSELRRRAKDLDVDIKAITFPFAATSGTGRLGENHFAEVRGDGILENYYETVGPNAPADFKDLDFGEVNVKTSSCGRFKAKCRQGAPYYWHFSLRGLDYCETIALVPLSRHGQPAKTLVVSAAELRAIEAKHVWLVERDIRLSSGNLITIDREKQLFRLLTTNLKKLDKRPDDVKEMQ